MPFAVLALLAGCAPDANEEAIVIGLVNLTDEPVELWVGRLSEVQPELTGPEEVSRWVVPARGDPETGRMHGPIVLGARPAGGPIVEGVDTLPDQLCDVVELAWEGEAIALVL